MLAIVDWARITEGTNEHTGDSSQSKTLEFNTNDSYINNRTKLNRPGFSGDFLV